MPDFSSEIAGSAALYAQKFDADRDAVFLVRMSRDDYRKASFLDDRVLSANMESRWVPYPDVERAMDDATRLQPLQFIFHTGHVGSTLLSRLIDETGVVLGLREPLPLRTLAEWHDRIATSAAPLASEQCDARLDTFLKLWRRGFADTTSMLVKATSSSGRLALRLLGASPDSKAVYLNLKAEPYLATLLAGANAMVDLSGFGQERARRLAERFGITAPAIAALSLGELAAMAWTVESLTQMETKVMFDERVMLLDFDALLTNLPLTLGAVLEHFGIAAPAGFLPAIERSAVLTRYSKAPEQFSYSPAFRDQLLRQARREHAAELSKGLRYLERLAKDDHRVAALL
jgi:hypothetical protein